MISIQNISKSYTQGKDTIIVLKDVSFEIKKGQTVAIVGPSGSGKSTLLAIMAGLDNPDTGKVIIDGTDVNTLSEKELAAFRNKKISIIFQSFELISFFTAYENSMLSLSIRNKKDTVFMDKLLTDIGIIHRKNNLPSELSGGEQQRVAIARALASGSEIIFADEPTGNLDTTTGKKILELFLDTVKAHNKTLVIITHDMTIAERMDVIYELHNNTIHKRIAP
jgi:putative ABC transport system ATP-binding protein